MPEIQQLTHVFPLLLAPAVIALARRQRRLAWLDGMALVWLAVCGAAVLWTVVLGLAMGEALNRAMVARGLLTGLVAAVSHSFTNGKGRGLLPTVDPPQPDAPAAVSIPADVIPRPPVSSAAPTVLTLPDLDFSKDPRPSVRP